MYQAIPSIFGSGPQTAGISRGDAFYAAVRTFDYNSTAIMKAVHSSILSTARGRNDAAVAYVSVHPPSDAD
jgi:hypothetical protein